MMFSFSVLVPVRCSYHCAVIIIIMEICKAPTLRLKALNKHTHIMYIEMENVISNKKNIKIYIYKKERKKEEKERKKEKEKRC